MRKLLHRLFGCWPFRKLRPFDWSIHRYFECRVCGKRTVEVSFHGYQPTDWLWLEGKSNGLTGPVIPARELYAPEKVTDRVLRENEEALEAWLDRKHAEAGRRLRG